MLEYTRSTGKVEDAPIRNSRQSPFRISVDEILFGILGFSCGIRVLSQHKSSKLLFCAFCSILLDSFAWKTYLSQY